jgi:hypothetical protein
VPKSISFACPLAVSMTFSGFKSRCTIPFLFKCCTAAKTFGWGKVGGREGEEGGRDGDNGANGANVRHQLVGARPSQFDSKTGSARIVSGLWDVRISEPVRSKSAPGSVAVPPGSIRTWSNPTTPLPPGSPSRSTGS